MNSGLALFIAFGIGVVHSLTQKKANGTSQAWTSPDRVNSRFARTTEGRGSNVCCREWGTVAIE